MSDELPPDVRATLAELLEEAATDARTRDPDSVRTLLETVETVTEEDVPPGAGRERLRHGSVRVRRTVENEPLVAVEYLTAMRRLVEDGGDEPSEESESESEPADETDEDRD